MARRWLKGGGADALRPSLRAVALFSWPICSWCKYKHRRSGRLANGQRGRGGGSEGGRRSGGGWTRRCANNQGKEERKNASKAPHRRPAPSEQRARTGIFAHWACTGPHCPEGPEELGPSDKSIARARKNKARAVVARSVFF